MEPHTRFVEKKGGSPSFCFFEIGHVSCVRNLLGLAVFTQGARPPCEIREGMKSVPSCSVWWKREVFSRCKCFSRTYPDSFLKAKHFLMIYFQNHRELDVHFVESTELLLFFPCQYESRFSRQSIEHISSLLSNLHIIYIIYIIYAYI